MRKFCHAYTLIELLAVIGIIAVLAAILFPVFAAAKASSKKVVCLSNMRQIGMASSMYQSEYDDTYVIINYQGGSSPNSKNDRTWVQLLLPYIKTFSVFQCPSDATNDYDPNASFDKDLVPGDLYSQYYSASMHTNAGYNFQFLTPIVHRYEGWLPQPRGASSLLEPSKMIVFIDSVWELKDGKPSGGGSWIVSPPCRYENMNGRMVDTFVESIVSRPSSPVEVFEPVQGWDSQNEQSPTQYGGVYPWHRDRANATKADGGAISLHIDNVADGCAVLPNWGGPITDSRRYRWNPR